VFEAAELFFVAADALGDSFEAAAQLVDLDGEAGERGGVAAAGAVLVDERAQIGPAVEGRAADAGDGGYLAEGDGLPGGGQLGAGGFGPGQLVTLRSAGMGLGDEQVEPFDETAVPGGLLAPAAGLSVGSERFGVDFLQ
jgi:hypothetical protein